MELDEARKLCREDAEVSVCVYMLVTEMVKIIVFGIIRPTAVYTFSDQYL